MKRTFAFLMTLLIMLTSLNIAALGAENTNSAPSVIPAIRKWQGSNGSFAPDASTVLVNISSSPAIEKVSSFFSEMLLLDLDTVSEARGSNEIVFTLDKALSEQVGGEGYILEATEDKMDIKAPTDIGLLYGGITVVQSLTADKAFPCGTAIDYPAYSTRSGMLDVGRAWIPMDYVHEITRYMAYYKLNEIHLHINDDGENGYSGFRLESDIKGLSSADGYYTKDEYRAYQKEMLEYGITVVTEIDTPFHSSCYANAENPPPYLPGNNRCLDVSKPETLEFVKNLFNEYMTGDDPVFVGNVVHIGTDEYPREYAEEMRAYTDALIKHINSLGYTPRFWGGLGEGGFQGITPISEDAQINFWDMSITGLDEVLASDYDVINTVNMILYTVPTTNYGFPDYYDLEFLYKNWQVNVFDLYNENAKMDPEDERLLGACFALWNDLHTSYNGVTRFDIFDRLRGMVCLMSEKTWCGLDTTEMSADDFIARYNKLSLRAGDADPGRHSLDSEGITVDFESEAPEYVTLNGEIKEGAFVLDGESYLSLTPSSVGFPNTLEFEIFLEEIPQSPLFSGDGVQILADADGKGNFGFKTEVYTFTYDYRIPVGEKVKIRLSSDLKTTYLTVNDNLSYCPNNALNPQNTKLSTLTVPLSEIGRGAKGYIDNIKLIPESIELKSIVAKYNLALDAATSVSGLEVNDGRFTSDLAVDGDENTRLSFAREKDEQWLIVDLGSVYPVSVIEISFFERVSAYEIYVSENGTDYTKVYEVSDNIEQVKQTDVINLDTTVNARYIKYVQLKRWFAADWNTYYSGGISEFRVSSFNEARYKDIIAEALEFLQTTDKSDSRRSAVRSLTNAIESYLAKPVIFTANIESLYNELSNAMQPEEIDSSLPEASDSSANVDYGNDNGGKLIPILAAVAGVAILTAIAVIIKKKKKK